MGDMKGVDPKLEYIHTFEWPIGDIVDLYKAGGWWKDEYDLSGKVTKATYPDGYYVQNEFYPGSGLLYRVVGSDSTVFAQNTNYEPTGKIGQINHANGTTTTYNYDPYSTRLIQITTVASSSGDIQSKSYLYTGAGDINEIYDGVKDITYSYSYDDLHRLTAETNTGIYDPISVSYNAIGNITSKTMRGNIYSFTYDTAHKHAVKTITLNSTPYSYTYDANGNMTGGPDFTDPAQVATRTITYNTDNMPTQLIHQKGANTVTVDIDYDGEGARAKKAIQGGSPTYYIGGHFQVKDGVSTKYIFAGNLRVAQIDATEVSYFHKDHLGSSTAITNTSGSLVESTDYMPFGGQRDHTGIDVSDYRFTDQELDPESGLYNCNARLYDPIIGRFISADVIVQNFSDPQTLNRYSYARNNPLMYVDPSGHCFSIIAAIVGAVFGAVISGVQSDWDANAMLTGAAIGFVSGGLGGGVGSLVSGLTDSPIVGGLAGGAVAGATARGMSASIYGGDIGEGILKGALYGGIGGSAFGAIGGHFGDTWDLWRVGAYTLSGGGVAEISGGSFEEGAMFSLAIALSSYSFNRIVEEMPTGEPGGEAVLKPGPHELQRASQKNNNFGFANKHTISEGRLHEGSSFSKFRTPDLW